MTSTTREYETEVPGAAVRPAIAGPAAARPVRRWPLVFIGAPAAVAVWSGWVGLGGMCGFGIIHPLPGIVDSFQINTAITLPVGVEAYGAYALGVWLRPGAVTATARAFAKRSAIGALLLGMAGQVIYHLLAAAHATQAPWPVVMLVSCLPVVAIGLGAALTHLLHDPAAARPQAWPIQDQAAVRAQPAPVRDPGRTPGWAGGPDARTDGEGGAPPLADADRASVVEMIAGQIRDAVDAREVWRPDYPALMALTGKRRSWCEKVVRDARELVLTTAPPDDEDRTGAAPHGDPARTGAAPHGDPARTDGPHAASGPGEPGPYADEDRAEELELAGAT